MVDTPILEIIRAHPDLSYDQAWEQACQAGVPLSDFDQAWGKVRGAQKVGEHDRRVQEIIKEIRKLGEETKTREEWKAYFKAKGYLDDECDMGYVLNFSEIDEEMGSPLAVTLVLGILTLLTALGSAWLMFKGYSIDPPLDHDRNSGELPALAMYTFVVPLFFASFLVGYLAHLSRQFKGVAWKVIDFDFNAKVVPMSNWKYDEWVKQGAAFLGTSEAGLGQLFSLSYDNRETYFGVYETYKYYQYREGRHGPMRFKKTKTPYFMIAQKTRQSYPWAYCRNNKFRSFLAGKGITLEGVDFNRHYRVLADRPQDAFYVLNPRVMQALLDPLVLQTLMTFETAGDWVIMVFQNLPTDTGMHFGGPAVRYADYQRMKFLLLHHLDLATNVNDVLSREIVDDGSKRSVAKNQ